MAKQKRSQMRDELAAIPELANRRHGDWDGDVKTTQHYDDWFIQQDLDIQDRLIALHLELMDKGPMMGMEGSKVLNLKSRGKKTHQSSLKLRELRIKTPAIRVLYTFDERRNAVLLVGGDKTNLWDAWYGPAIKQAEKSYQAYVETQTTLQRGGRR